MLLYKKSAIGYTYIDIRRKNGTMRNIQVGADTEHENGVGVTVSGVRDAGEGQRNKRGPGAGGRLL